MRAGRCHKAKVKVRPRKGRALKSVGEIGAVFDFKASAFDRRAPAKAVLRNVITSLHASGLATVEELLCAAPSNEPRDLGHTDRFHIVLPLAGSFYYSEGSRCLFGGANHALLVPPRREYAISHPIEGDRSLVVFPRSEIGELFATPTGSGHRDTELRAVTPQVRLSAVRLLSAARMGADSLALDELTLDLCRAITGSAPVDSPVSLTGRGATLARAREYLHTHYRDALSLGQVAAAVGVTSVYLTQLFKRSAGMSLHQYVIALRLNEALFALSEASDLTALALDLGFSSHSHFSAVFRARFGATPSAARRLTTFGCALDPAVKVILPQRPLCVARGGDPAEQVH
jgi:AraC family transcriptional regulator